MNIFTKMLVAVIVLPGIASCHGPQPFGAPAELDDSVFMALWSTYRHCRSSSHLETIRKDLDQLERGASLPRSLMDFALPVPAFAVRMVVRPAHRLAVDPNAMTIACTLHAGHIALATGQRTAAAEVFQSVIRRYAQLEYAYYVEQARIALALADKGMPASSGRSAEYLGDVHVVKDRHIAGSEGGDGL